MAFFFRSRTDKAAAPKERLILSIDGGGMRGIIPSQIIGKMARRLKEKGDRRPFYSHFGLIAGTSTGALIASALSTETDGTMLENNTGDEELSVYGKYTERKIFRNIEKEYLRGKLISAADPETFTDVFIGNGPAIFPQKSMSAIIGPVFADKYSGRDYEKFLQKLYGKKKMEDLLVPTLLISYSSDNGTIFPITSWRNKDFYLWEATRASSAAPLYFPPFSKEINGEMTALIDGGIAANNPSLIAYEEARGLYPESTHFHILSLSTGERIKESSKMQTGGIAGWGSRISSLFQNAQLSITDTVLPSIPGVEYTRIWSPVLEKKIKLDETGKDTIRILLDAAERIYREQEAEIEKWIDILLKAEVPETIRLERTGELPPPSQEA